MSKYLNRLSFTIQYFNASYHRELLESTKVINSIKNREELIEYYYSEECGYYRQHKFIENRLNYLFHDIGGHLMREIGKYEIKNTGIIHFSLNNNPDYLQPAYYSLGEQLNKCGSVDAYFDFDHLLLLEDIPKKNLMLDFLYQHLLEYLIKFNLPKVQLDNAYEKLTKSDFVHHDKKGTTNKGRQYRIYKKSILNFKSRSYWLVLEDLAKQLKKDIFVCEKELFFGVEHPELTIHDLLKLPHFLKYEGWIDKTTYKMTYGDEEYLFCADSETFKYQSGLPT